MKVWEAEQEEVHGRKEKEKAMVSAAPAQPASTVLLMTVPWNFLSAVTCDAADQLLLLPQAEFEAEQDYMKTLSYLSEEQQKKYKDRSAAGSWLYI